MGHGELAESLWVWRTGSSKRYEGVLRIKLLVQKANSGGFGSGVAVTESHSPVR